MLRMAAKNIFVQTRLRAVLYREVKAAADRRALSVAAYVRMVLQELMTTTVVMEKPARPARRKVRA